MIRVSKALRPRGQKQTPAPSASLLSDLRASSTIERCRDDTTDDGLIEESHATKGLEATCNMHHVVASHWVEVVPIGLV